MLVLQLLIVAVIAATYLCLLPFSATKKSQYSSSCVLYKHKIFLSTDLVNRFWGKKKCPLLIKCALWTKIFCANFSRHTPLHFSIV